jgi:hypothetical protein
MLRIEEIGEEQQKINILKDELKFGICIGGPIGGQVRTAIGMSFKVAFDRPYGFDDLSPTPLKRRKTEAKTVKACAIYHYERLEFTFKTGNVIGLWIYEQNKAKDIVMNVLKAYSAHAMEELP